MKQGLWMAVSLGAVAASQPVQAQETLDSEIVVTAQKREQALIDVPQSVSAVSGATLEQQQAVTFQDFAKLVPGLQLEQSNTGEGSSGESRVGKGVGRTSRSRGWPH